MEVVHIKEVLNMYIIEQCQEMKEMGVPHHYNNSKVGYITLLNAWSGHCDRMHCVWMNILWVWLVWLNALCVTEYIVSVTSVTECIVWSLWLNVLRVWSLWLNEFNDHCSRMHCNYVIIVTKCIVWSLWLNALYDHCDWMHCMIIVTECIVLSLWLNNNNNNNNNYLERWYKPCHLQVIFNGHSNTLWVWSLCLNTLSDHFSRMHYMIIVI